MRLKPLIEGLAIITLAGTSVGAGMRGAESIHARGFKKGAESRDAELHSAIGLIESSLKAGLECADRLDRSIKRSEDLVALTVAKGELAELRLSDCEANADYEAYLYERIIDSQDQVLKKTELKIEADLDLYQPCTFDQMEKIHLASEWIKNNGLEVESFYAEACPDSKLCTGIEATQQMRYFNGMILDLDQTQFFCPSKDLDDGKTLGETLKDSTPQTPAQVAIFPAVFRKEPCELVGTIVHEIAGHAYTGARHIIEDKKAVYDWIYLMDASATITCKHSDDKLVFVKGPETL